MESNLENDDKYANNIKGSVLVPINDSSANSTPNINHESPMKIGNPEKNFITKEKQANNLMDLDKHLKDLDIRSKKPSENKGSSKDKNKGFEEGECINVSGDDDSDDDEEAVLESSPCGRFHKRKEQVKYRDVPGIDVAYLAMDSEEGVEVVWNEARFTSTKKFKAQEENMRNVFEALTTIDHPNIVKFHKYWIDYGPPKDFLFQRINDKSNPMNKTDVNDGIGRPFIHETQDNSAVNDAKVDKQNGNKKVEPRLIFITEYVSSGSLKQFLRKTKKNNGRVQLQSWKRWCIQILSALNHLHTTCDPPIVHGNLNCDTIFIQHNGLVKIGSVAPDIIHHNVKTTRDDLRNLHFFAPEWGEDRTLRGQPIDIYAFGVASLETAVLNIRANPHPSGKDGAIGINPLSTDGIGIVTEEAIKRSINQLEDKLQKDFIEKCLIQDPDLRPSAGTLLRHPVLFEVHSLKLLAAHVHLNTRVNTSVDTVTDEIIQAQYGQDTVKAIMKKPRGKNLEYKMKEFPVAEKLGKFMEDVEFGIYPITAFALCQPFKTKTYSIPQEDISSEGNAQTSTDTPSKPPLCKQKDITIDLKMIEAKDSEDEQETDEESGDEEKSVDSANLKISKSIEDDLKGIEYVTNLKVHSCLLHLGPSVPRMIEYAVCVYRLENSMNRQASTWVNFSDTPLKLAISLVEHNALKANMVIAFAAMFTRGYIQRSREIDEFWDMYMKYQEEDSKNKNDTFQWQPLPHSLKSHQLWLVNVARYYGILDDRPGINDKQPAPDDMVYVHDSDVEVAIDWIFENKTKVTEEPPTYYNQEGYMDEPWIEFEKKVSGEPLVPVKQKKPSLDETWPKTTDEIMQHEVNKFPYDAPARKLKEFLKASACTRSSTEMKKVKFSTDDKPSKEMIKQLKTEIERAHFQYKSRQNYEQRESIDETETASVHSLSDKEARDDQNLSSVPLEIVSNNLRTNCAPPGVRTSEQNESGAVHKVDRKLVADTLEMLKNEEMDVLPMSPIPLDRFLSYGGGNSIGLAHDFTNLPQLMGDQKYVVVPETDDGQPCPAMFLDNEQLVNLQVMANAQAQHILQDNLSDTPLTGHTQDQNTVYYENNIGTYLQQNYSQPAYSHFMHEINPSEPAQHDNTSDFLDTGTESLANNFRSVNSFSGRINHITLGNLPKSMTDEQNFISTSDHIESVSHLVEASSEMNRNILIPERRNPSDEKDKDDKDIIVAKDDDFASQKER